MIGRLNDWDYGTGSAPFGAAPTETTTRAESNEMSITSLRGSGAGMLSGSSEPEGKSVSEFVTKDSGKAEEFPSGYRRDCQEGKGLYDELPFQAIAELARLFERGAKKYGKSNWRKGAPLSRYCNSMLRHGFQATAGYEDEAHFIACAWNALCAFETRMMVRKGLLPADLDDLPKPEQK